MANRSNHDKYTEDSQYKYGIGFFRREEAKPLILARRKCNDYPERE